MERKWLRVTKASLVIAAAAVVLGAIACTKEVVVEQTVVVQASPQVVKETVVVQASPQVIEKTVVVAGTPQIVKETVVVKETQVVQSTVVVVQTATATAVPPTATPRPAQPVVWRIGMPSDISSINLWHILGPQSTHYNAAVFYNQFPTLMTLSDARYDWVPQAAAETPSAVTAEGDKFVTTVKLRKGMKWGDGTDVTSSDFKFTVDTAKELELPGNWASLVPYSIIDKIDATDAQTIKITFNTRPGLSQWQYGLSQVPFVQKKFWEPHIATAKAASADKGKQRDALFAIVPANEPSAGEMAFKKWEKGAFVESARNASYYFKGSTAIQYKSGGYEEKTAGDTVKLGNATGEATLTLNRGPAADSTVFSVFTTQDAAVLALQKGEIDYYLSPLGLSAGLSAQLQGKPGVTTVKNTPNSWRYMTFNVRKKPLDDKAFRNAIATLIDREFLTSTVLQGVANPAYSLVPEGNGFWYNPDVAKPGQGMTREQRVNEVVKNLKAAGYTWTTEPKWNAANRIVDRGVGLKMPNGTAVPQLEMLAPSAGYDPLRATSAIWIEQWLNDVGIPVKANLTGFNVIVDQAIAKQNFDMFMLGYGLTIFPNYLADFFLCENAVLGGNNPGGYCVSEVDSLLKSFQAETDLTKARDTAFKIQKTVSEDSPWLILFSVPLNEAYRSDKVKFPYTSILEGLANYFDGMNGLLSTTSFN